MDDKGTWMDLVYKDKEIQLDVPTMIDMITQVFSIKTFEVSLIGLIKP